MEEPFAGVDTGDLSEGHARAVEISRTQYRAHGSWDSPIAWKALVIYDTAAFGLRRRLQATLALAEDGMVYCRLEPDAGLLWCVSVRPPNACRIRRGHFWISRIDGKTDDAKWGRLHPFMVSFSSSQSADEPRAALFRGRKPIKGFREVLASVGAQVE